MKIFTLFSAFFLFSLILGHSTTVLAKPKVTTTTTVYAISAEGLGEPLGTLTLHDTIRGLVIVPNLKNLTPGVHGFHMHENADCSPGMKDEKMVAGLGAGGHFDPDHTSKHEGPAGEGHRGDLPFLTVNDDGTTKQSVLVPHLKLTDVTDHAFIIHEGGDNYSDEPTALGGGGTRVACAVVF
jgi:Cu-Zn family superoxide dismutase